ncbi:MAG: right-handed parallel beta-helix repeat-containing protein [Candidatus Baldrarchaeia archaeon]
MFNRRNAKVAIKVCFILVFLLEIPLDFHVNAANAEGPQSIQELINSAIPGSTVQVPPGTYYESNIEVNKSVILKGAGPSDTIIDGGGKTWPIIKVLAFNVTIEGFTIRNTASDWETYGIILRKVSNVTIRNTEIRDCYFGITVDNSSNCKIVDNIVILNFACGLVFRSGASNNLVAGNLIRDNPTGIFIYSSDCKSNIFFHNNIINNENQVINYGFHSKFDNGFEGNYWSDYSGVDLNEDGIGDSSYRNLDGFPLMGAFHFLEADYGYGFEIVSNSTIISFTYNTTKKELRIKVEGSNDTLGFCRICIPYVLISPPYQVIIDEGKTPILRFNENLYHNSTHQWIYFSYLHSMHEVRIIPEEVTCQFILLAATIIMFGLFFEQRLLQFVKE